MSDLMVWIIMAPLLGGLLAMVWPRIADVVAVLVTVLALVCSVLLVMQVDQQGALTNRLGGWEQGLGIAPLPHYVGDSDPDFVKVMDLPRRFHRDIWILTHPDLRHTARISAFMKFMYKTTRVAGNR